MSRHKHVKAINDRVTKYHNVDDDFGDGYDDDEEEEGDVDEEQMLQGLQKARAILGGGFTDKEIRDSLWYTYYDVDQTVDYLLKQQTAKQSKPKKPKELSRSTFVPCSKPVSAKEFFKDCPWLNVPEHRKGEILVEPLYPRGGLLGGASLGKPSKLAALAAARRKKDASKSTEATGSSSSSVAILDKLGSTAKVGGEEELPTRPRKYPLKQKKQQSPEPTKERLPEAQVEVSSSELTLEPAILKESVIKEPSMFARVLCGLPTSAMHSSQSAAPSAMQPLSYDIYKPGTLTEDPFAGPSPDDIVAKAQSASKGLKSSKAPAVKDKGKPTESIRNDIDRIKIDDAPQAKSKNLDVLAEYNKTKRKNAANFVVIGHVDAGKSTLMGRLLYDLKVIDERTVEKFRREAEKIGKASFALAWIMDSGSDEREHGVTIDIASNHFETDKTSFTILDAPGHQDFVPAMIAGAAQADFAVLVVDASIGSFESGLKGQTKEHALLVRSIGVQKVVVAVNKLDSVSWSQDRYDEISQQVSAFLTAAGFKKSNISFVPCSGLTGDNITRRTTVPQSSWYTGPILLEQLDTSATPRTHAMTGPLRMPISEVYSASPQYPLSCAGRITSGSIQVGDKIVLSPFTETGFIRALDVDDEPADWAVAGMNVTLHLSHLDPDKPRPGNVICAASAPIAAKKELTIKVLVFETIFPMFLSVIVGRVNIEARVENPLVAVLDKSTGEVKKRKPKVVKAGDMARLKIAIEEEPGVPIEVGERLVLREKGLTVATGLVEDCS